MKWFFPCSAGLAMAAISLAGLTSCKKPGEAVKSDLGEAGYQLTDQDWFRASRENDAIALKKFVLAGFDVDLRNPDGDSALHIAASAGADNSADFLLDRGMSVDLRGGLGRTPLMAAVIADQTTMVRWLLRQGADPRLKDDEGFMPLMLAVREGSGGSVAELAPYTRENLDDALLLAALVGRADVIDSLTNYGASVYARMEDGRTPLMIAAENGHQEAVALLLDIGAARYTIDADGYTAAEMARNAGHEEIVALISREPLPGELALESPEMIARSMDEFVDGAVAKSTGNAVAENQALTLSDAPVLDSVPGIGRPRPPAKSIDGEVLSNPIETATHARPGAGVASSGIRPAPAFPLPPLVMRHYREREVPIRIRSVEGNSATVEIAGPQTRELSVRAGETIPGSRLLIVRVETRMEDSKVSQGQPTEVAVVDVRDTTTGTTREWISGVSANAHDPVALVEDSATGQRYVASPGQRFTGADGTEFIVSDVRPNQMVIEETATGAVRTIPLRGPRG